MAAAEIAGCLGTAPQRGIGRVQLGDFGCRTPGQVFLAGLGEKFKAVVPQALCKVEAGRAFADQCPMPRALTGGNLISRGVEGQGSRPHIAGRPSPLGLQQPQQVQEIHGCVFRAGGQPTDQLLEFSEQRGTLVRGNGSGMRGEGQTAKQAGHRGYVVAEGKGQRLHRRGGVMSQARRIVEDGGGNRAAEMSIERHRRDFGVPVDRRRLA